MAVQINVCILMTLLALAGHVSSQLQCSIPGQCVDSDLIQSEIDDDKYACHNECKNNEACKWFTFNAKVNFCELFETCNDITEESCEDCVTSQKDCDVYQCGLQGSCQGHIIKQEDVDTEGQCLKDCQINMDCQWYTFNEDINLCLLFETCPTVDETCSTCTSGENGCSLDTGMTKLLVTTGFPAENSRTSEVINLSDPSSSCSDYLAYPVDNVPYGAVGALINGTTPFICGGYPATGLPAGHKCYFLGNSNVMATMTDAHYYAAALPSEDGTSIWTTGGSSQRVSTEFVSPNKEPVNGPDLPEPLSQHCLVQLDETTYMIIGGINALSYPVPETLFFHTGNQTFTTGPRLSAATDSMMCQVLETSNGANKIVVVAGGIVDDEESFISDKIETWTVGSSDDFVKVEAVLPNPLCCAGSVVMSDKKSMVIVGGYDDDIQQKSLIKVSCNSATDCQVETMVQELRIARNYLVAMLVPDSIVNCN